MACTRKSSRPQTRLELVEDSVHGLGVHHVARHDQLGAELGGQRADALLEGVALVGEGDLGALGGGRPGDAPGDRTVVRYPHDEAPLASHQVASGNPRARHRLQHGQHTPSPSRSARILHKRANGSRWTARGLLDGMRRRQAGRRALLSLRAASGRSAGGRRCLPSSWCAGRSSSAPPDGGRPCPIDP